MDKTAIASNVIVLGMHRSGTSMVSGFLQRNGFHVGSDAELLKSQEDNPLGFFERQDALDLNDIILEYHGGSWFNPPENMSSIDEELARQAQDIIKRLGDMPWLLKDPRLLPTWPYWEHAVGEVVAVYVYRSPVAVAASLQERNGFPPDFGLALWEFYNRRALQILQQVPFVAVSYEDFCTDPQGAASKLLDGLIARGVNLEADSAQSADFFNSQLNHSDRINAPLEALLTDAQRQLTLDCEKLVETGQLPGTAQDLDPQAHLRLTSQAKGFGYAASFKQLQTELGSTRDRLAAVEQDYQAAVQRHESEIDQRESQIRHYQSDVQHYQAEIQRSETELQRHEADLLQERQILFQTLSDFDRSIAGRLVSGTLWLYRLLTLRYRRHTAYEDLMATAQEYLRDHPPEAGDPRHGRPRSRLSMLFEVASYMIRNPAASMRSVSWPRLKRGLSVFAGSDRGDLETWVEQRFPSSSKHDLAQDSPVDDEHLDTLQLQMPPMSEPRVSIVIPAYNQYRMTINCLQSLLQNLPSVAFEVILADDGSSDLTTTIEDRVQGLRIFRPEENQGFVRNCNSAAELAQGEYLLLLNNDTAFHELWLDHLVEVLDQDPNAGIVGPQLLFPNGRLQEAGGIIWNDASGWNYGRMDDPTRPEYCYRKPCDYVSGACLLVRRSLWEQLGGFDERFVPAYYEDTDLCFAARAAGYKVIYQPHSQVIHFEGMTNGTDLGSGIKKYQVDNQAKFLDKWSDELSHWHYPNGAEVFRARDRSRDRRTILVIDHYVPSFDKDAGSRSTWMYLKLLVSMGYKVMFMGANFFPHQPYTTALQAEGIEVLVGESIARRLSDWLEDHAEVIDTVYIHRPHIAEQFIDQLQKHLPRSKLIYFGHDLHYLRSRREEEVTGSASASRAAEDWYLRENRLFEKMQQIYYPSQVEVDVIRAERPELNVRAIPLYALEDASLPVYHSSDRSGILFVGGFGHPPNADAICWFVQEVLPLVRAEFPEISMHVVGSNATQQVLDLASHHVKVHGYLSDAALEELYSRVQQVVVPLRFGAGVKGKIIEAVQHGVPVTTTWVGAEGLPDAESVLNIADDPQAMADFIASAAREEELVMEKLALYEQWLQDNFSRSRAMQIIREDFGEPELRGTCAT